MNLGKKVSPTDLALPSIIMSKIMKHPDFHEVATLVKRNTSGKIYLVGGKIYRTAIELIHGYECGSKDADWDFLCEGEVVRQDRAYTGAGWSVKDLDYYGYKEHSLCLQQMSVPSGLTGLAAMTQIRFKKIDIIGIKDIRKAIPKPVGTIHDYLDIVPLDVQSIALATDNGMPTLYGLKGMKSIEARTIKVNNAIGALPNLDLERYIKEKAQSLRFEAPTLKVAKIPCSCFPNDIRLLWRLGCQSPENHV